MVHATPTFLATVILVTILLIAPPCLSSPDGAQTIDVLTAYTGLRGCAQLCFWQPSPGGFRTDVIASYLSCSQVYIYSGALESCWCRADYRADVLSHLASCVRESCAAEPGTYTVDVERATSLYAGYCASAESVAQADVGAGITSAGGGVAEETGDHAGPSSDAYSRTVASTSVTTTIPTSATHTSTTLVTSTTLPSSSSSTGAFSSTTSPKTTSPLAVSKNGLSGGEISGIVLGVLTLFVTVVGIWYARRSVRFQELMHSLQGHQQQTGPLHRRERRR